MEFRENPNITASRYFETNDSPMIANTSPFDRDNSEQYTVRINEENLINYDNDSNLDILAKNSNIFHAPNEIVDELIRDCASNRSEVMHEPYKDLGHHFLYTLPQSPQTIPSHVIDTQYTPSCSKDVSKNVNYNARVSFTNESNGSFKHNYFTTDVPTVDAKKSAEKTTYCRPMVNVYSQQFVHKAMQRNARLQRLVEKLVLARQREKQETWNNYINELKNKHRYNSPQSRRILTHYPEEQDRPELMDDYYSTRFICGKSNLYQNLLQDFYGSSRDTQTKSYNKNHANDYNDMSHNVPSLYENYPYCYPTSSQGRLKMLQKERDMQRNDFSNELKHRPNARFYRNNTIIIDNDGKKSKSKHRKNVTNTKIVEPESKKELVEQNECLQTEITSCCTLGGCPRNRMGTNVGVSTENQNDQSTKDEYEKVSDNVLKLKKKIQENEDNQKQKSSSGIEGKLDILIKSINILITELKSKSIMLHESTSVCECIDSNEEVCNDECGHIKDKQIFYSMVRNSTKSAMAFSHIGHGNHHESFSKLDQILHEEMDKSNKIKRDLESILKIRNDRPCSVHISFDIPTRERSTEVTHSLSKTRVEIEPDNTIEEIIPSVASNIDNHMTIAVNTDPLGLLALLRVSTETMKQMLSYMPQIDCYSYLSMLQFPQLSPSCASHYICNICGAAFRRPSQLSDHIQEHNIGNTRDCCVCLHALDTQRKRTGLYSCQYCGKRFTRAYCCELHQQSCARRLGKLHDVASSLMLLK